MNDPTDLKARISDTRRMITQTRKTILHLERSQDQGRKSLNYARKALADFSSVLDLLQKSESDGSDES